MKMKIKECSSEYIRCISPNLYNTLLGDLDYDEERLMMIYEEHINFMLERLFGEYNCYIKTYKYYHPKYYNFEKDEIIFELIFKEVFRRIIVEFYEKHKKAFLLILKETWKSRDGFISFVPYEKDDFEKAFHNDDMRAIMVLLDYMMCIELRYDYSNAQMEFEEECMETFGLRRDENDF